LYCIQRIEAVVELGFFLDDDDLTLAPRLLELTEPIDPLRFPALRPWLRTR
jgi:hypothetical protein